MPGDVMLSILDFLPRQIRIYRPFDVPNAIECLYTPQYRSKYPNYRVFLPDYDTPRPNFESMVKLLPEYSRVVPNYAPIDYPPKIIWTSEDHYARMVRFHMDAQRKKLKLPSFIFSMVTECLTNSIKSKSFHMILSHL